MKDNLITFNAKASESLFLGYFNYSKAFIIFKKKIFCVLKNKFMLPLMNLALVDIGRCC